MSAAARSSEFDRGWRVTAMIMIILVSTLPVVAGLHYVGAHGGNPPRTHGNHLAGRVFLATAGVLVLCGVGVMARRGLVAIAALVLAVVVAGGGVAWAEAVIRHGESCACEGG